MRILYQPPGGPTAVLIPAIPQYIADGVLATKQLDVLQVGIKDVPAGLPFWIVRAADVPADRSMREAWALDTGSMGEPHGVGTQQ